jgi:hypothetical protein
MAHVESGVRFMGCTLWADFDLLVDAQAPMSHQLKARDRAYRAANFYLRKYSALEGGAPMLAERLRELALIEPLRTLRLVHYSAWLARRWDDPIFPINFPWFGTPDYWRGQVQMLEEQLEQMQEPLLMV